MPRDLSGTSGTRNHLSITREQPGPWAQGDPTAAGAMANSRARRRSAACYASPAPQPKRERAARIPPGAQHQPQRLGRRGGLGGQRGRAQPRGGQPERGEPRGETPHRTRAHGATERLTPRPPSARTPRAEARRLRSRAPAPGNRALGVPRGPPREAAGAGGRARPSERP